MVTWNSANLTKGQTKELALTNLLITNSVDVAFITETELDPDAAISFALPNYTTFLPPMTPPGQKVRVLALVKSNIATSFCCKLREDLCTTLVVWLELSLPRKAVLGGVYRP